MNESTKKKLLAGGGIIVAAVGVYYAYKQYQATEQQAQAAQANEADQELQALQDQQAENPYAELYAETGVGGDVSSEGSAGATPATASDLASTIATIESELGLTNAPPTTPTATSTAAEPTPPPPATSNPGPTAPIQIYGPRPTLPGETGSMPTGISGTPNFVPGTLGDNVIPSPGQSAANTAYQQYGAYEDNNL